MRHLWHTPGPVRGAFSALTLAFAAIVILTTGCEPAEPRVDLFHYNGEDPYIRTFVRQIQVQADGRVLLETYDARNSQTLQNEQIDSALNDPPDLILVNPVDRLSAYTVIRRAMALDVPVIFFNREPLARDLELWDRVYYVGAKADQSARLQAQLVMNLFGDEPDRLNDLDTNADGRIQTIILKGEQGHQDAEIRTSEVLRSFEVAGFVLDVLAVEVSNWNREEAYADTEDLLREYGDSIELVLSNNDAMAIGAIERMREMGFFSDTNGDGRTDREDALWLPVIGIDGIEEAVAQIEAGYLYGTVTNDSGSMAEAMIDLAVAILADSLDELSHELDHGRYIWIDYQPFTLQ